MRVIALIGRDAFRTPWSLALIILAVPLVYLFYKSAGADHVMSYLSIERNGLNSALCVTAIVMAPITWIVVWVGLMSKAVLIRFGVCFLSSLIYAYLVLLPWLELREKTEIAGLPGPLKLSADQRWWFASQFGSLYSVRMASGEGKAEGVRRGI